MIGNLRHRQSLELKDKMEGLFITLAIGNMRKAEHLRVKFGPKCTDLTANSCQNGTILLSVTQLKPVLY